MIFAIDPGNVESAYVFVTDDLKCVCDRGKVPNEELLEIIYNRVRRADDEYHVAIEMIASYGMAVGATVFDTCVWIGRFTEAIIDGWNVQPIYIYRKDEKITLCGSMQAKDANIRQALIDRFGDVGTKKNPGYFYGFKKDIWQAMAVAVAFHDNYQSLLHKE